MCTIVLVSRLEGWVMLRSSADSYRLTNSPHLTFTVAVKVTITQSNSNIFQHFSTLFNIIGHHSVFCHHCSIHHYENLPMQYTKNFFCSKIENFHQKNFDIFLIFAQNIDCGYTLEPPRRGGSNEYPQSMFRSKNKKNR